MTNISISTHISISLSFIYDISLFYTFMFYIFSFYIYMFYIFSFYIFSYYIFSYYIYMFYILISIGHYRGIAIT